MSAKAFVVFVTTLLSSGDPSKTRVATVPETGFDVRVREWHADHLPSSYQLTFTVAFNRP